MPLDLANGGDRRTRMMAGPPGQRTKRAKPREINHMPTSEKNSAMTHMTMAMAEVHSAKVR
jgi:hypothetical protein